MKNNIMIIILVTLIALGVIITVIISSVASNSRHTESGSTESSLHLSSPGSESTGDRSSVSSTASTNIPDDSGEYTLGDEIVTTARIILDRDEKVPFVENGATLDGFDNSGFIYYVLRENGFITCPRSLQAQTAMGQHLEYDELKSGDLVFFFNDGDSAKAGYGGIYTGSGTMIACLKPGTFVDEVDITGDYYREHFFCGVSLS